VTPVKQKWTVVVLHNVKKFTTCLMKLKRPCAKDRAIVTIFLRKAAQITSLLRKILGIFLTLQIRTLFEN
jgi:hypothetical protein